MSPGGTWDYFKRLGQPIIALATAPGGPVAILRISGRDLSFLAKLFRSGKIPGPGRFELQEIISRRGLAENDIELAAEQSLDRALVLFFQAPHSYTGENVLELQVHGVGSLIEAIMEECLRLGVQRALPGEFSFRAVIHNKMSLEEAERLQTALGMEGLEASWAAKLLALKPGSENGVNERLEAALRELAAARGRVEGAIDFPEAESEQQEEIASASQHLHIVEGALHKLLSAYENFCASAGLPRVAIIGEPNVGKSTLLNRLAGGPKALVSSLPGTTRDIVEAPLRLPSGRRLRLLDTAGQRHGGADEVETTGMEWGLEAARQASLVIWVRRAAPPHELLPSPVMRKVLEQLSHKPRLEVFSHGDLHPLPSPLRAFDFNKAEVVDWVLGELDRLLKQPRQADPEDVVSARQGRLLELALDDLSKAKEALAGTRPLELCAQDLRTCEEHLRRALGQGLSEDYIGEIFKQFCLGK